MKKSAKNYLRSLLLLTTLFVTVQAYSDGDSFEYNLYNNYGVVGTIHTPSARTFEEGVHGMTVYYGDPNQTVTLSASPFDWLEASFFYTNVKDRPYCYDFTSPTCLQDFKDKGFNFKVRLKEQGKLPAIAIGLNDFAGTGIYLSLIHI